MSTEELEKTVQALQDQVDALTKRVQALESGDGQSSSRRRASQGSINKPAVRPISTRTPSAGRALSKHAPTTPKSAKKETKETKDEGPEIDSSRVGHYVVSKRKVYYVVPSYYTGDEKSEAAEPSSSLKLDYIYGYNGRATRSNLFFVDRETPSKLLYNVAATSVVFDTTNNTQSFFVGHDEDILSLAKHPSRPIAATGQLDPKGSGKPYIVIWNYETMKQITRIDGYHDRGIIALQFTPDGKYLFSIGNDDSHFMAVWDWENDQKHPLAESMVSKDEVYGVVFNPHNKEAVEFCTFGLKHTKLWTMKPKEESKSGNDKHKFLLSGTLVSSYKKTKEVEKATTCAIFLPNGECVVGTLKGDLNVYKDKDFDRAVKAHSATVGSITATDDGIVSAGADGKLCLFKNDLSPSGTVKFVTEEKKSFGTPNAVDFAKGIAAVGTTQNQIFLVDCGSQTAKMVMSGNFDEFWGLAVHPTEPIVVTGSQDRYIRAFNTVTKTQIPNKVRFFDKDEVHSCAFSPDGKLLAAGFKSGRVVILDFETFEIKHDKKHRKEQIDAIAFSPNGQLLAVGSWDQMAELIDVESKNSITLKGHTSSITHLTFSADSKYLTTNSRDYEILFWDVQSGKRVERNAVADVQWGDWTNILGWPVKGIFRKGMDGTDINAANISGDNASTDRLVATGDDSGHVILYKYPVVKKEPNGKEYSGHSSHVTNVRFSKDGKLLFSAGGLDCALFQWNIV